MSKSDRHRLQLQQQKVVQQIRKEKTERLLQQEKDTQLSKQNPLSLKDKLTFISLAGEEDLNFMEKVNDFKREEFMLYTFKLIIATGSTAEGLRKLMAKFFHGDESFSPKEEFLKNKDKDPLYQVESIISIFQ